MTRLNNLIEMAIETHEVDETGDAAFVHFLREIRYRNLNNVTLDELLTEYLTWANGPNLEPKQ